MSERNYSIFFIPFVYTFGTRLQGSAFKVAWFIRYFIPQLTLLFWFTKLEPIEALLLFLLASTAWVSLYETGYIQNDSITFINESNGTRRLSDTEIDYARKNIWVIHTARLLISIMAIIAIAVLQNRTNSRLHMSQFCVILACMIGAFQIHNFLRSQANLFSYLALSTLKFLAVASLVLNFREHWSLVLFLFLLFPLPRSLEHAAKVKYHLVVVQLVTGNFDFFRVFYLAALALLILSSSWPTQAQEWQFALLITTYFLIFRLLALGVRLVMQSRARN